MPARRLLAVLSSPPSARLRAVASTAEFLSSFAPSLSAVTPRRSSHISSIVEYRSSGLSARHLTIRGRFFFFLEPFDSCYLLVIVFDQTNRLRNKQQWGIRGELWEPLQRIFCAFSWRRQNARHLEHTDSVMVQRCITLLGQQERLQYLRCTNNVTRLICFHRRPHLRKICASRGGMAHLCNPPVMFSQNLCASSQSMMKSPSFSTISRRHEGTRSCGPAILKARIWKRARVETRGGEEGTRGTL